MKKSYNLKIIGKVQGVGFRYNTKQTADRLGVMGFVKNEYDGSVYIEAEAEVKILDEFMDWCKLGWGYARVDEVNMYEQPLVGYSNFVVKY